MRNPRTAFETNASTSNLATLNQNKFIQYATGLVNNTRGFNCVYTFGTATNTMRPTSLEMIDETFFKKVISTMYGTDPNNWLKPNWTDGATLPCSLLNLPMQFPSYYAMYANKVMNNGEVGWQMINEKITKVDASALIGKKIIDYNYSPTLSYLSMPWNNVYTGRTQTGGLNHTGFKLTDTSSISLPNQLHIDNAKGQSSSNTSNNFQILSDNNWKKIFTNNFNRYIEPIECGQYIKQGLKPSSSVKIQPSLHVGVCAVPQLTTTNAYFVPDKFIDIECTWDIQTEMICEYGLPYTYSHFPTLHTELENALMVVDNVKSGDM